MTSLKCRLGRHEWEHRRNPEVAGRGAEFDQCRRCGKERNAFEPGNPSMNGPLPG